MSDGILTTKLHIPRVKIDLVMRQALIDRLKAGLEKTLTIVCAPAGYGKTTFISQALSALAFPVTWLTLDKDDNEVSNNKQRLPGKSGFSCPAGLIFT